jgi:GTPase SAR1 family protein
MANNRQIDLDEAEDYAKSIKGRHFDTSAKTGKGIEEMFTQITKAILKKGKKRKKSTKKNDVDMPKGHEINLGIS